MNNQNNNMNQPLIKKEYIVIRDPALTNAVSNYYCTRAIIGVISLVIFIVVIIIIVKQTS
jgi:hypothetical protein